MKEQRVTFASDELFLEGIIGVPEGGGPFPAAVVCHPHPLYGGDMYNNVVSVVSVYLVQASVVAFRFNFRGVGGSHGEFGQGVGEQDDVRAAVAYLSSLDYVDAERIGFAGYSAGAGFGVPAACADDGVKALSAISPPLSMFDFSSLFKCRKPKLMISGSRDDFTPAGQFTEFCGKLPEPKESGIVEGADHFWLGYEGEAGDRVAAFLKARL